MNEEQFEEWGRNKCIDLIHVNLEMSIRYPDRLKFREMLG